MNIQYINMRYGCFEENLQHQILEENIKLCTKFKSDYRKSGEIICDCVVGHKNINHKNYIDQNS